MRGDCLIIAWHPQDREALDTAHRIEAALLREPHVDVIRAAGLMIASEGARTERLSPSRYMIGELFSGSDHGHPPTPKGTDEACFEDFCGRLASTRWGSYLAMHHDPHAPLFLSAFAEPIGAREWSHWRHGGATLIGSDADRWISRFPPLQLGLELEDVAHIIHYPAHAAETAPLSGVAALQAGAITRFGRSGITTERLWTPRDHCDQTQAPDDPAALADIVDASVAAWSAAHHRPMVELSGGLDSAIVAASLRQARNDKIEAFTFFSDSLAGDERRFSRAVAEKLGLVPHELEFPIAAMDDRLLDGAAVGVRPGIGSTTFFHDRQLAAIGSENHFDALFTGRGGDALFFQHPTPLVARDVPPGGKKWERERLEALARWCRTSVWSIAIAACLPAVRKSAARDSQSRFCSHASPPRTSTWAGPLGGLSAGKRMQIEAIAGDRNAFGPSRCAQSMRVIHPLLSQPIVEYVLGRSLMTLTQGRRDRAMARAAFAERLPAALIDRRGKGSLSYFYGQTLVRSLPVLRERLLEGALADAGLVDRVALEQALDADHLIQSSPYGEIIRLLVIERWMRGWKARLSSQAARQAHPTQDDLSESRSPAHRSPANLPGCR